MATPTRPTQDAIIDPVWGQLVHDTLEAQRRAHYSASIAAQGAPAPAGALSVIQVVTIPNAMAGVYTMTATAYLGANPNSQMGIHLNAEAPATGTTFVLAGAPAGSTLTGVANRAYTHPATGPLTVKIAFGNGAGNVYFTGGYLIVRFASLEASSAVGLGDTATTQPADEVEAEHRDES